MKHAVVALTVLCLLRAPGLAAETVTTPEQHLLPKAAKPIDVDGALGEWDMAGTPYVMTLEDDEPRIVLYQNLTTPLEGPKDLTTRAAVKWDDRYLYVAGQVTDDHLEGVKPGSAPNQGPPGWGCDSLMVAVACYRQPMTTNSPIHKYPMLALRYAPTGPETRGTLVKGRRTNQLDERGAYYFITRNTQLAIRETPDGYNLEAAIPWADMNMKPVVGERLFLAFLAADRDPGQVLNQIGWGYTGHVKEHPLFRLTDGRDALATITTSVDEVAPDEPFAVRVELDALQGTARLEGFRIRDGRGREVLQAPLEASEVTAGHTGTALYRFRFTADTRPGDYTVEALATVNGQAHTVVATRTIAVQKPTAEALTISGTEGQVGVYAPQRTAHTAQRDHQTDRIRHGFVQSTKDYVPWIRKWVEPRAETNHRTWMRPKLAHRAHRIALQMLALSKITGERKYAQWARELIDASLKAHVKEMTHTGFYLMTAYRYLTWLQDPDTPYAPPNAEKLYRQALHHDAAQPDPFVFTESGQHNRIWHRYATSKIACMVAAEDVGSSRVDLQACKLEYSIVSPK